MDTPGFKRLVDVLGEALLLPERERAVFIERACAGDAKLLAEARSLLAEAEVTSLEMVTARIGAGLAHAAGSVSEAVRRLPAQIGPYRILGVLGEGGMGVVYRARDPRLKRDIAIKVLPGDVASSPDRLERLEREATTVAGLNHPNIVVLHSIEDDRGTRFLTMELVEGRNLADLVTPGGLPLAQMLDLAIPLADALSDAHGKGVVHRDLKPANVMVTRGGRVKVLDFGVAKLIQPESDLESTQAVTMAAPLSASGEVVGTAPYMAPEQIRGEAVDARTDLFSFGVLVYELAAGERPFTGHTYPDVRAAILHVTPPALTAVRSDLPADFERIISRCLEKQPHERFQTALDVVNELRELKRTLERGALPPPKPRSEHVVSIAVLPFLNRSASADDDYFSDGLADELLNMLTKIDGLRVAARTSAFHFKGKDTTIAEVGHALNVATVLEGSVRKAGSRVRISVQLVKVADGYHMWSETYDRTLDDIFAVQDDIAQSVVKELRAKLLGEEADSKASGKVKAEVSKAAKGRATNPEAYRLYLQGRQLTERLNPEDMTRGIQYIEQALGLDREFPNAWAVLAWAYLQAANLGMRSLEEARLRAREAVERALELEQNLADAHAVLAHICITEWDWRGAEVSLKRALELAPGNAVVLRRAGVLATHQGRFAEAIRFLSLGLDQDPLSSPIYHNLGWAYRNAGQPAAAEQALRKALELAPQRVGTRAFLAMALQDQGRGEEGLVEAMREPYEVFRLWALAMIQHALGHPTESSQALGKLIETFREVAPFQVAEVNGNRGEADAAFEWLERAYAARDPGLSEAKISPELRSLHGDPRWAALVRKLGFEE